MVVQKILPISLIHHHQFNPHDSSQQTTPINITDHLGKLKQVMINASVVKSDDLFKCMKTFLIFGKCIGLVPISGVFSSDLHQLKFRKCSISGLITLSIILILSSNTGLALAGFLQEGGRDATQLAKNLAGFVCYSLGLYVFIFIYLNSQKLIHLFHKWREIESSLQPVLEDSSLRFNINIIAGLILTSAIAENAVSHLLLFPLHEQISHPLEYYYINSHKQWSLMIPYHPMAAIGVFICNKLAVYAWNFGDIFIAVISRALYGKFKSFLTFVEQTLLKSFTSRRTDWFQAIQHHNQLSKLTQEFAALLSPLVFTSFAVNIYFICIQLHLFLAPSKRLDFISALYGGWSFLHLIARTYTVALSAAKINDYAHHFFKTLNNCPRHLYTIDVERAQRELASNPVALDGLGAFHIGRPFILSVISVIFTFEIVLLQTSQMIQPTTIPPTSTETIQ